MPAAAITPKNTSMDWSTFVEFAKIDAESRMVSGWATVEQPDTQLKIVDYDSVKAAFGSWVGNMREMHDGQRLAVGKAVNVVPDDAGRRVWIDTYVSKSADGENTWTKIQEGILKGFSIGGRLSKRVPEIIKDATGAIVADAREYVKQITEVSYVDNPAMPDAVMVLTKSSDFLADLPVEEPAPAPDPVVPPAAGSDTYLGPDGQPMAGELSPDQVAAAKAAMPNLAAQETPVATTPAPAAEPVPIEAAKAAAPTIQKDAADDVLSAHVIMEGIDRLIELESDEGDQVAQLRTARAAMAAFEGAEAAEIGTPADADAQAEEAADAPVPVVIVADYSYYAAVAGDLAKLAITRKDNPDAPITPGVQQIYDLAKAAGAVDPTAPDTITKAAVAAAVDEAVGSDETIAKYASGLVDRMGPLFDAVKSGLLGEFQLALAPMSEQIEKIAARPVREGPFRYAPGRGGELLRQGEEALGVPIAEALAKAAGMTNDPALREELGRLSAAAEIRGQMG